MVLRLSVPIFDDFAPMLSTKEIFRELELTRSHGQSYKVVNIYTKKGTNIFPKRRLCEVMSGSGERIIIKAKNSGVVTQVLVNINDTIGDGSDILELEACAHSALMGNICCDCGILLEEKDIPKTQAVSMLHSVPDLKIARNEAQKLGKEDINNLLKHRKLVLLVDLDQTLIHTTNDNIPADLKDVYHFQINPGGPWYHARLRPHTKVFLEKISKYYELHISTFGVREYAHHIAHFLDPNKKLFGQRILSRNECLDMMSKKANLDSLFPCGDNLVCIIDDRTDVWNYAPNVVQVVPYHFFRHTGDINAPQGLQKKENDDKEGIDFKNLKKENLKAVGYPGVQGNEEEEEKKNYSSDSDSEKDSREGQESKTEDISEGETSGIVSDTMDTNDEEENTCDSTSSSKDPCDLGSSRSAEVDTVTEKGAESKSDDSLQVMETVTEKDQENKNYHDLQEKETKNDEEMNDNKEKSTGEKKSSKEDDCDGKETVEETGEETTEAGMERKEEMGSEGSEELQEITPRTKRNDQVFDVIDNDDYLLYLEDILKKIHKMFFLQYDLQQKSTKPQPLPDLKKIVPGVRKEVLKGVNLVFSGVVPQQMKLKDSKAFAVATSFGAGVSERLIMKAKGDADTDKRKYFTTHVVAANRHTEKVNSARKQKSIKVVTPNWLWKCAERWELVEEQLFPLNKETEREIQRLPPHHCFFPTLGQLREDSNTEETIPGPSARVRTASGNFLEDVNPLMFMLSKNDKSQMSHEVEEILSDEADDSESDEVEVDGSEEDSNSYEEDEEEGPVVKRHRGSSSQVGEDPQEEAEKLPRHDELPSVTCHQGGGLPSDDSEDEGDSDDEGDLSRMGADLESLLS